MKKFFTLLCTVLSGIAINTMAQNSVRTTPLTFSETSFSPGNVNPLNDPFFPVANIIS